MACLSDTWSILDFLGDFSVAIIQSRYQTITSSFGKPKRKSIPVKVKKSIAAASGLRDFFAAIIRRPIS